MWDFQGTKYSLCLKVGKEVKGFHPHLLPETPTKELSSISDHPQGVHLTYDLLGFNEETPTNWQSSFIWNLCDLGVLKILKFNLLL